MDGKLTISNMEFLNEYRDHNSPIYMTIKRELEDGIKDALLSNDQTSHDINVKVMNLT